MNPARHSRNPNLSTEGNEAKEELVFQRNANSNFVFIAVFCKEFLRKQINRSKRRYRRFSKSEITTFVSFVAFCKNSLRCIHFMRRRTNSAPKSSVRQSKSTGTKGQG